MRSIRVLLATGGILLLVTSCASAGPDAAPTASTPAPAPSSAAGVDLDAARTWVERVQEAESDGPGAAGVATLLVGPDDDGSGDDGVRIDFASPTALTRADARCFGGGTVEVEVTLLPEPADADDSHDGEIPCDEEPHEIDLGGATASGVRVEGESMSETYLHVTIIEGMTVER